VEVSKDYYCVIMAGGIGTRFWPLSRIAKPKQFLDILGIGKSLLRITFDRFATICPLENIFVVSSSKYAGIVSEQLPEMHKDNILLEPFRRNTAPCIAYASYKIMKINPNAKIVVTPSDHLILNLEMFQNTILKGLEFVSQNPYLLTIGIHPNRPETGFGYIQVKNKKSKDNQDVMYLSPVATFTEKPDINLAMTFLESGDFYWNSGVFMWSLNSLINGMKEHLSDIDQLFVNIFDKLNTHEEEECINKAYTECRNISIDYGLMEKSDNVWVICADFGWSDLGTWGAMFDNTQKDANNNCLIGNNVLAYDTSDCVINLPGNKVAVIQGLKNYIVVESDQIMLICDKNEEQRIRQFVNDVLMKYGEDFV